MEKDYINRISFFKEDESVLPPTKGTSGSIGYDVFAYKENTKKGDLVCEIQPFSHKLVSTGLRFILDHLYPDLHFYIEVHSRSGLALKNSLFVLNSPGIVDSDYRGIVGVILANFSNEIKKIYRDDPIAQLVFKNNFINFSLKYVDSEFDMKKHGGNGERGEGGFGSTRERDSDMKSVFIWERGGDVTSSS